MARFSVGCVPYVNAIPLVFPFESLGENSPVRVVYDVPSRLPALLESGEVQAILVSIYDPLTVVGRSVVSGVCIGSDGPVQSVRIFSRKPFGEVESLGLDASSMTSNALAQIVLRSRYGCTPAIVTMAPNLDEMLAAEDACVLIGDAGMEASSDGLFVSDLGEEWKSLTGLPFVWAAWVGDDSLDVELSELLKDAFFAPEKFGVESNVDRWVEKALESSPFSEDRLRSYFLNAMRYEMDSGSLAGIERYRQFLGEMGAGTIEPRFVGEFVAPAAMG